MLHCLRRFFMRFWLLLALIVSVMLTGTLLPLALTTSFQSSFTQGKTTVVISGMRGAAAVTTPSANASLLMGCTHSGNTIDIVKQEFGWDTSKLNPKYLHTTLCDDTMLTLVTSMCLPAPQLFQSVGWPTDLLVQPYESQVICNNVHQRPQSQQTADSCTLNAVDIGVPLVNIDYCKIVGAVWKWMAYSFTNAVNWVITQAHGMTQRIPPEATYNNPAVQMVWNVMIAIVDGLIIVAVLWIGLRWLISGTNAIDYASAIDVLPRLFLSLLLAHFSMRLAQLMIDFNNALCDVLVNHVGMSPIPLAGAGSQAPAFFVSFMQILQGVMSILVVLQAAIQLAGIAFAIPLAPLCLFCLFHPDTQRLARIWISGFCALCLMRFLQVLAIAIGSRMLGAGVLNSLPGAELLNLVIGTGVLIVAFLIPGMLRQWVLMPVFSGGSAIGGAISTITEFVVLRSPGRSGEAK